MSATARVATREPSDSPVRARILAAAERRFAAHGYRRTGVAEIAREAGLAAGTLYRYFASKEDVFRAVVGRVIGLWLVRARAAVAGPGTAVERLARMGQASVEFRKEDSLVNSVFRRDGEIIYAPLLDELHDALLRENVALIAEVLRDGVREGTLRDIDPERAAYVLFLAGDVLNQPYNQRYFPYQEVLPVYVEILMRGLLPR
jgi:TetR/AcrR family transcriptional regulator